MLTDAGFKLHALLIGIDYYSNIPLLEGVYYPNLGGCVRDINHIETMLKSRLGLKYKQITKLSSSNSNNNQAIEPDEELPTYENIVNAFKKLIERANDGDQVYIHYSGHGGRCATMFPELHGENGLDESIVPCDIGKNGACYLRDVEIAYLLREMSEKNLLVTLVIDSCHSGGATRGTAGGFPRGINQIDTTDPPEKSLVADKDLLVANFKKFSSAASRSFRPTVSWDLPLPDNCVVIAACRANELANEYAFDGKERNGALTYWMLDALNQLNGDSTYQMLYNRLTAKVHAKFADQTPQIEGDRDRKIFGGLHSQSATSVNIIDVDADNNRIKLNTGFYQGVTKSTQFAVFGENITDFSDSAKRLAVVEIEEIDDSGAWARLVSGDLDKVKEGSKAVLLGIPIRLRGRIRLIKQGKEDEKLDALANEIAQDDGGSESEKWIRLTQENETADFTRHAQSISTVREAGDRVAPVSKTKA